MFTEPRFVMFRESLSTLPEAQGRGGLYWENTPRERTPSSKLFPSPLLRHTHTHTYGVSTKKENRIQYHEDYTSSGKREPPSTSLMSPPGLTPRPTRVRGRKFGGLGTSRFRRVSRSPSRSPFRPDHRLPSSSRDGSERRDQRE